MNRKERRFKRRFKRRKIKAIRKCAKKTYLAIVKIKESDHVPMVKLVLSVSIAAAFRTQIDLIRHSMYTPKFEFEKGGISNKLYSSPDGKETHVEIPINHKGYLI